jgi:hypothetical protein
MMELTPIKHSNTTELIHQKLISPKKCMGNDKPFKFERGIEYWLMIIGYAIGYGSFWRFPYLVYSCGYYFN